MVILYVDDDADDCKIFNEVLKRIDPRITCMIASNAKEALAVLQEKIKTHLPDLVFLDINMPGMDGIACLHEIRKDHALDKIPVVIFSTTISARNKEVCRKLNAIPVEKPITYAKYQEVLSSMIEQTSKH